MLLGFAIFVAVWMMLVFAIPKVMFDGEAPFPAMKESFSAALANLVPIIVFALVLGVGFLIVGGILSLIPLLGAIAAMALLYAILGVSYYVIWRDVYGVPAGSTELPPPPPA
jgi:uncharacterized membrane protein